MMRKILLTAFVDYQYRSRKRAVPELCRELTPQTLAARFFTCDNVRYDAMVHVLSTTIGRLAVWCHESGC